MERKICKKCNIEKMIIEYSLDPKIKSGRRNICKLCTTEARKLYKKEGKQQLITTFFETKINDVITSKVCSKCNIEKDIDKFHKHIKSKDGYCWSCIECNNYKNLIENREEFERNAANNMKKCIHCKEVKSLDHFFKDKKTKLGVKPNCKICLQKRKQIYTNNKKKTDPRYKIECTLRIRLRKLVKNNINGKNSKGNIFNKFIGCTTNELIKHLESKFTDNMSWSNHGQWHIDHIIPCSNFNFLDPDEHNKCFHYTNLQPLWGIDNIKKSNKLICT